MQIFASCGAYSTNAEDCVQEYGKCDQVGNCCNNDGHCDYIQQCEACNNLGDECNSMQR